MNKLAIGIFICALFIGAPTCGFCADYMTVTTILKNDNSSPKILFKLKNISNKEIALDNSEIPNGANSNLIIDAVTKSEQNQLQRLPIGIDSAGVTIIQPGDSINSELVLKDCIKDLASALMKDDVVVFWRYQPKDKHSKMLGSFSGSILIPRAGMNTGSKN